jgi:predicted O-methyltransferase YrrM
LRLDQGAVPTIEVETVAGRLLLHRDDHVITPVLQRYGMWEPGETRYLLSTLTAGQTFVDVGAHVGYFSVLAARRVGPAGSVIAIEPELRNLELLRRNLERNDCTNAVVLTRWSRGSRARSRLTATQL